MDSRGWRLGVALLRTTYRVSNFSPIDTASSPTDTASSTNRSNGVALLPTTYRASNFSPTDTASSPTDTASSTDRSSYWDYVDQGSWPGDQVSHLNPDEVSHPSMESDGKDAAAANGDLFSSRFTWCSHSLLDWSHGLSIFVYDVVLFSTSRFTLASYWINDCRSVVFEWTIRMAPLCLLPMMGIKFNYVQISYKRCNSFACCINYRS